MDDLPAVEPCSSIPKTLGLLNVIFAGLLLLCGACTGFNLVMQVILAPMMEAQQKELRASVDASHQKKIDELRQKEDAAKDTKAKAALQKQRQALEANPPPRPPNMGKMNPAGNPQLLAYSLTDLLSGVVLNIAMLTSGIGLLNFKEWGRRLGMWVAGAKIARLFLLYGFFIVVIAPTYSKQMMEMFQEMAPPGQGLNPQQVAQMGSMMGVTMAVCAGGMIVLGAIYPAICLWLLPRASVKAACKGPIILAEEA